MIQIKNYSPEHRNEFFKTLLDSWNDKHTYDAVDYTLIDPWWYEKNVVNNPDYIFLLAIEDYGHYSDVCGFMVGKRVNNSIKIIMLLVHPIFRGMGIGEKLKCHLTWLGGQLRMESIFAINRYDNPFSYNLNKKLGWTETKIDEHYYKAEYMYEYKKIKEWEAEAGVVIHDPDGFDRTDMMLYDRHFSREDFLRGMMGSTQQIIDYNKYKQFTGMRDEKDKT